MNKGVLTMTVTNKTNIYWIPSELVPDTEYSCKINRIPFQAGLKDLFIDAVPEERYHRYTGIDGEYENDLYDGHDEMVAADADKDDFYKILKEVANTVYSPAYQTYLEYKGEWLSNRFSLKERTAKEIEYWRDYFSQTENPLTFDEWFIENNSEHYKSFEEFSEEYANA